MHPAKGIFINAAVPINIHVCAVCCCAGNYVALASTYECHREVEAQPAAWSVFTVQCGAITLASNSVCSEVTRASRADMTSPACAAHNHNHMGNRCMRCTCASS